MANQRKLPYDLFQSVQFMDGTTWIDHETVIFGENIRQLVEMLGIGGAFSWAVKGQDGKCPYTFCVFDYYLHETSTRNWGSHPTYFCQYICFQIVQHGASLWEGNTHIWIQGHWMYMTALVLGHFISQRQREHAGILFTLSTAVWLFCNLVSPNVVR